LRSKIAQVVRKRFGSRLCLFIVEVAWTKGQPFPGGYSRPTGSSEKDFERFRLYELWTSEHLWICGGSAGDHSLTLRQHEPRSYALNLNWR
jgi:hypothetical protein